jgi:hypothetical protein
METKVLLSKIAALGKRNNTIKADIQVLGLACLEHIEAHGDVMPLNRLVNVLQRSQVQAFAEWSLAFGKVKKNEDKATKADMPLSYDKSRSTDIEGATDKNWDEFAADKGAAVKAAFDLQKAVQVLLKKAAEAGQPQSILDALAVAAGVDAAKVPRSVKEVVEGEAAPF